MTLATILIVTLVIAMVGIIIAVDVLTVGRVRWLNALRQWQTLIGTMLGFATAAGILALSTSIQHESRRNEHLEALANVGQALAIEAATLDSVLERAQHAQSLVRTVEAEDGAPSECPGALRELGISLSRETPIYDAAVPHFIEVGEPNLGLFVAFYGAFGEVKRDLALYLDLECPVVLPETAEIVLDRVRDARTAYATLSTQYTLPD